MIRQAIPDDIPAIRTLMRSEPGFWHESWRNDTLERVLAAADGLAFVWEDGGRILGFVSAHDLGFRAYLSELIVAREDRTRGIGTRLVQKVEEELRPRGCSILISDVWKGAKGFYKALGWSQPDVILLRKKLDE
jgi:predicted N-acetyltransferase YhbS